MVLRESSGGMKLKPYECCICGRQLTSPTSIARGTGDECAEKRAGFLASCDTSEAELAAIAAHPDEYVNRWARNFCIDMRNGNAKAASLCIKAGRRAAEYARVYSDYERKS